MAPTKEALQEAEITNRVVGINAWAMAAAIAEYAKDDLLQKGNLSEEQIKKINETSGKYKTVLDRVTSGTIVDEKLQKIANNALDRTNADLKNGKLKGAVEAVQDAFNVQDSLKQGEVLHPSKIGKAELLWQYKAQIKEFILPQQIKEQAGLSFIQEHIGPNQLSESFFKPDPKYNKELEDKINSLTADARNHGISYLDFHINAVEKAKSEVAQELDAAKAKKSGPLYAEIEAAKNKIEVENSKQPISPPLESELLKTVTAPLTPEELVIGGRLKEAIFDSELKERLWNHMHFNNPYPDRTKKDQEVLDDLAKKPDVTAIMRSTGLSGPKIEQWAKGEIDREIKEGKHDKQIAALRETTYEKTSFSAPKLIAASREELRRAAVGVSYDDFVMGKIERLQKNHGVGIEALHPDFEYKKPMTPEALQQMQKEAKGMVERSKEPGRALHEVHDTLKFIEAGEMDVDKGIAKVKRLLGDQGLDFDALDKERYDPNNPKAPHKSVDEMKEVVKGIIKTGNENRKKLIKWDEDIDKLPDKNIEGKPIEGRKKYNPVDPNLDVDDLLKMGGQNSQPNKVAAGASVQQTPAPTKDKVEPPKIDKELVELLKGKMLNDAIRSHVFSVLINEQNPIGEKRKILDDALLEQDFSVIKFSKEKDIAARRGISDKEFNNAYYAAKASIAEEIGKGDKGEYGKRIKDLKEEVREKISPGIVGKQIQEVREALGMVASGHSSGYFLRQKLKEYDLGMEVLDPRYDHKNPNKSPTATEMEKILTPIFEKAEGLCNARQALYEMEVGKIGVKYSIEAINKHLASAKLGYDALDPKFDLRNPDASHKTSAEMKEEIKAAAEKGNAAREINRKNALERSKNLEEAAGKGYNVPSYAYPDIPSAPDRTLDLDKLLNLPEGKKTSANPPGDKFLALMDGVQVSKSIVYSPGTYNQSVPQFGEGRAIV